MSEAVAPPSEHSVTNLHTANRAGVDADAQSKTMVPRISIDPARAKVLAENLTGILSRISAAAAAAGRSQPAHASAHASSTSATANGSTDSTNEPAVRLICVSKLKPANDILALHQPPASCLHFGENYAQELQSKAALLPRSIRWHFIGGLQTNKCRSLATEVSNLWCVSSLDSVKKADALDKGRAEARAKAGSASDSEESLGPLRVQIQVNTSGEEQKSGTAPGDETVELCRHIKDNCPNLQLAGLMTIGAIARSQAANQPDTDENEDFIALREARSHVVKELGLAEGDLGLSMGMSADFEVAIRLGSDEVRVGSSLFGERPPKKEAKITA